MVGPPRGFDLARPELCDLLHRFPKAEEKVVKYAVTNQDTPDSRDCSRVSTPTRHRHRLERLAGSTRDLLSTLHSHC
jgi:hypothetical protein